MYLHCYDKKGMPIDFETFTELLMKKGYRIVKQTTKNEVFISTIWLGLNHAYQDGAKPLIFETMVFFDDEQIMVGRWETEVEAIAQHNRTVIKYNNKKERLK